MNPLKTLLRPVRDLTRAVTLPLQAAFVVGVCALVNWWTFHGTWWVKWVAFGMGIATLLALARGARALLVLAVVGWVGWKVYQRHGAAARARFDDWVRRAQPGVGEVLGALRGGAGG
jgi:hypothetical protein